MADPTEIRNAYETISRALEDVEVSEDGRFRINMFMDDVHWLLFEKPTERKARRYKSRTMILYAIVERAGIVAYTIICGTTVKKGERVPGLEAKVEQAILPVLDELLRTEEYLGDVEKTGISPKPS